MTNHKIKTLKKIKILLDENGNKNNSLEFFNFIQKNNNLVIIN